MWSNENASAWPLKQFRLNWSHSMIVASFPIGSPCHWLNYPWPISIKSNLNNLAISLYLPPPNHLFIIVGGILESLSHFSITVDMYNWSSSGYKISIGVGSSGRGIASSMCYIFSSSIGFFESWPDLLLSIVWWSWSSTMTTASLLVSFLGIFPVISALNYSTKWK